MPSILESLTSLLGQGDTMSKLGTLIGGDADDAGTALDAAGPALIGGLADTAAGDGGADTLGGMLDDADGSILDNIGDFLDGDDDETGGGILDGIFGDDRSGLLDGLASQSGLDSGMFTKLLPKLAPILMGSLSKLRDDDELDADGMVGLLSDEREALESDGKLGDWFGGLAKGGAVAGALGGAAALAKGKLGDAKDKVADKADDAKDAAADKADGAKDKVADKAGDAKDAAAAKTGDAKGKILGKADDVKGAAAATAGGAKAGALEKGDKLTGAAGDKVDAGRDRAAAVADNNRGGGLGWLWWAVGAVLLVLFLAWLLNQCGNSDSDTDASATTVEVTTTAAAADDGEDDDGEAMADDEDGVDLQAAVDGVVGDGVTGAVDGDSVTLSGTVDSEDAKAAAEEAALGVDGINTVVNEIEVAAEDGEGSDDAASGDAAGAGTSLNDELDLAPITFNYRSADITADGETVLGDVIAYLEANEVNVEIQGHTDSDGTEAENVELSQRRAESVRAFLEANGIDAGRMTTVGLGESDPKVDNDTADNKAINRRIEFVVAG